ncbi:MAG: hypothetical protein H6518_13680 [Microthrixaceae bacterium]|nr:hypothetical protein [Microthrixaceae bacterium]
MLHLLAWPETRRRLPRLLLGLVLCGVGLSLLVRAELGLDPWDVFHQGVADHTGIPIGTVSILTGVPVLLAWIPLRERIGLGTVLNVVLIGLTIDATLALVGAPEALAARVGFLVGGTVAFAVGSGFYIGAGLGPGPRDGLMTSIAHRGHSVRVVRTTIEVLVLAVGWLLGGTVGVGTLFFAATIGPLVHLTLPRLTIGDATAPETVIGAE